MEFWCQTKQRVEDFHTSDVWECCVLSSVLYGVLEPHFAVIFFFDVSLFAILYGSLLIEMFHDSACTPDSHILHF